MYLLYGCFALGGSYRAEATFSFISLARDCNEKPIQFTLNADSSAKIRSVENILTEKAELSEWKNFVFPSKVIKNRKFRPQGKFRLVEMRPDKTFCALPVPR